MAAVPRQFSLIPRSGDPTVVESLKSLLQMAEAGEIIGLVYVALQPRHDYVGDLVGNAVHHPVMALGLVKALEDQITTLLRS